jgi:predicted nucleotidyltransferase
MKPENTREKVLELIFDFPTQRFHIREIARMLKISAPAVSNAIKKLESEGFLVHKKGFISEIYAKIDDQFRDFKRINNLKKIYDSGLPGYLNGKFPLATIVLFGSYSRGEDIEKSDIDIAIFEKEKKLEIELFEKKLNKKINIEFIDFSKASSELKESLINGIVLFGNITLK